MKLPTLRAWLARLALPALASLLAWSAATAQAQEDPPGRVGRLSEVQGTVSWYDNEQGTWTDAERNRPLTGGDRLSTGPQGQVEVRVGSTVLRLGATSELEVLRLDDERMVFQLHSGSLALRVRSREVASDIEVATGEVRFKPERSGHYRFDRVDDTTLAGAWRGTLRVDDKEGFILETGQRAEFWRERRGLQFKWSSLPGDAFADWVQRDDLRDDQRSASNRYVSPEMTGAEDLDRAGRWERHPEYGAIWYPSDVRDDWAPYRYGRWVWVSPWGWTWVDESAWGFAPFHYGRWVSWRGRWGWCPGDYVARPVYAPALVAWVGGPRVGVSINIGGPAIGWVPLAPREWYVPQHRVTPVYVDRVNPRPYGYRGEWRRPEPVVGGVLRFSNQGVQGGLTVIPSDVLGRREPVQRHAADPREVHRTWGQQSAPVVSAPERMGPPPRVTSTVPAETRPLPPARNDNPDRGDRVLRSDRPERTDRFERNDRSDRMERTDRTAPRGERDRPQATQVQIQPQPQPQQQPQVQVQTQPAPQPQAQQQATPALPPRVQRPSAQPAPQPSQVSPPTPAPAPARVQAAPAQQAQPAPQSVGPQPPRPAPAEAERKRGPDNRGGKESKEVREQQR